MHIYFPGLPQAQRYCGILWFLKTFSVEKIVGMARKIMRELTAFSLSFNLALYV